VTGVQTCALPISGQVLDVPGGSRDGRYLVLRRLARKDDGVRYLVMSTSGRVSTLGYRDITDGSLIAGELELPGSFRARDKRFVNDTMRQLRRIPPPSTNWAPRVHATVDHPVASCPDASRHLAAARRATRTRRRIEAQHTARRSSGHGLVEEFSAIRDLLEELDYLHGWSLTPRGQRLRAIYNESDLLLAEAIENGLFYGLEPAELAAIISVFVYEPRSDTPSVAEFPTALLGERWEALDELWKGLIEKERRLRLTPTRRPDPGFGILAHTWASGTDFDDLPTRGMAPGDFVRVSRQLVDLLRQLREAAPGMRDEASQALKSVDRGVVAAQGVG